MRWIQYGAHGWARVNGLDDTPGEPVVYVHTFPWEGRRVISRVVVSTNPWEPITSATLKSLPIGWIESMVNTPEALAALAEQDDADPKNDPTGMALHELGALFLFKEPPYAMEETPKLSRPDGTDPESFYRQVAEAYVIAVRRSNKPAADLADQAGVPVATVHRWIAEARRRGHLAPARKGRAG